ncbi:hypothetical protein [Paraburkholderia fynbosensis]|uniref:Uncharacterized protein n=1 Tax=Paraburkholderia fynbosensis TaxID=1200993 RepID=A0A6J5FKX2_9BURK|nr:hypothetical protein [Paraburkholderia fynbosensis]CAB3782101.1 hypothetical protein LMG27177_01166 [Paraburkholderia fynbosensis]
MTQPLGMFQPRGAQGATPAAQAQIAVTTSVQQINLPAVPVQGGTMRMVVDGSANIAWSYGVSASLSMTNGVPMLANTIETFTVPDGVTQLSVIGAAAGSTLRIVVGDGQ